jgi:hypothetical protein
MDEQQVIFNELRDAFQKVVELDHRISRATGRSVGYRNIADMHIEMQNNARRLFCLSIEELAYNDVINKNEKITDVAKKYARSPSHGRCQEVRPQPQHDSPLARQSTGG